MPVRVDLHLARSAFTPRDVARAGDVWRVFQEAAVAGSSAVGWPPGRYRETGTAFVVRQMTVVHHRETRFGEDDLKALFKGASEVVVTKGKKAESFKPGDDGLAAAAVGRSGNLRAPAVRVGKRWLVGGFA